MKQNTFYDKNGREILPGMKIRVDDDYVEKVVPIVSSRPDLLGVREANLNERGFHPEFDVVYRNLFHFSPDRLEIVKE